MDQKKDWTNNDYVDILLMKDHFQDNETLSEEILNLQLLHTT